MKERVHVNDLTTLFICPSMDWETLERRALADCLYLRDCGGNPILFCLKNSKLDIEADKVDLPRIYYTGVKLKRLLDIRYIRDMKRIFRENRFDIVHCYNVEFIWGVCFALMPNPKVPLILTFNHFLPTPQKGLWQRWLFRRVDMVVTFCQTTKEIVQETLPVSLRKIKIAGGGADTVVKQLREESLVKKLGCIVTSKADFDAAKVAIYAFKALEGPARDLGIEIEFNIFTIVSEEDAAEAEDILTLIAELELQERIFIKECSQYEAVFKETDIYIGTSFDEPFNDFEVMASLARVPVIFPRTAFRQLVLYQYKWVGESYFFEDARELKSKLLKVLINEQVYLNELQDSHQEIRDLHGSEAYFQRLIGFYERLYTKRIRFLKHKENLNYS